MLKIVRWAKDSFGVELVGGAGGSWPEMTDSSDTAGGGPRDEVNLRLESLVIDLAAPPELRFNLVAETRGLAWVEQLRPGGKGVTGKSE